MSKTLIVEDEQIVALDIARCLESGGHEVVAAVASASDAIAAMGKHEPDIVLLDISLSGEVDGIQLASQISEEWEVPVVFLTAHGDDQTVRRAQTANPSGYLVKPFKDQDLLAAVTTALHQFETWHTTEDQTHPGGVFDDPISLAGAGDIKTFLAEVPVFRGFTPSQLEFLAQSCKAHTIEPGKTVAVRDEESSAFIVVQGCVAIMTPSNVTPQVILTVVTPRDAYGLFSVFEEKYSGAIARTIRPSRVLTIPRRLLLALLDSNPTVARAFSQEILTRLREAHTLISMLTVERAEKRVVHALRSLLPHFSRANGSGKDIAVEISRKELAGFSGLTLETTVRVLRRLSEQGLVDLSQRRSIKVVDLDHLSKFAAAQ